jgi:hypothetical protein
MGRLPKSRSSSDHGWTWITDAKTIQYLSNPSNLECLVPFFGRELTLSQVTSELGTTLGRMHYQVTRLIDLGLLRISRTEPRAGRAFKYYTALSERLFLPFDTTSFATLEEALERSHLTLLRGLSRQIALQAFTLGRSTGLRLFRGQSGGLVIEPSVSPDEVFDWLSDDAPAMIPGVWTSDLCLDFAQAKALQRELEQLRERYSGQSGGHRYQLQITLVASN